jgi:hypothetical protein
MKYGHGRLPPPRFVTQDVTRDVAGEVAVVLCEFRDQGDNVEN